MPTYDHNRDTSQVVYARLRELITRGNLAPGARVLESEVADRFEVSRTPVRQATRRLAHEGYIRYEEQGKRRSSAVVAPLTRSDAYELFMIVGALEGVAARRVASAEEDVRDRVSADLGDANELLRAMTREEDPSPNRLFDLDSHFHQIIVDAGSGPRLEEVHGGLKPQTERYVRTYMYGIREEFVDSLEQHRAIIEAISKGDPERAAAAVAGNWHSAGQRLSEIVDNLGERGVW